MIEVRGLVKNHGSLRVLDSVSLALQTASVSVRGTVQWHCLDKPRC